MGAVRTGIFPVENDPDAVARTTACLARRVRLQDFSSSSSETELMQ